LRAQYLDLVKPSAVTDMQAVLKRISFGLLIEFAMKQLIESLQRLKQES